MNSFGVPVLFTTPSLQQNCLKESLLWILMWTPDLRTLRQDTPQFKLNLNHTAIFHLKITAIVVDERTKIENIARIWRTLTTSFKFSLVKANTTVIKTGSNEGLGVEPSAVWKKITCGSWIILIGHGLKFGFLRKTLPLAKGLSTLSTWQQMIWKII